MKDSIILSIMVLITFTGIAVAEAAYKTQNDINAYDYISAWFTPFTATEWELNHDVSTDTLFVDGTKDFVINGCTEIPRKILGMFTAPSGGVNDQAVALTNPALLRTFPEGSHGLGWQGGDAAKELASTVTGTTAKYENTNAWNTLTWKRDATGLITVSGWADDGTPFWSISITDTDFTTFDRVDLGIAYDTSVGVNMWLDDFSVTYGTNTAFSDDFDGDMSNWTGDTIDDWSTVTDPVTGLPDKAAHKSQTDINSYDYISAWFTPFTAAEWELKHDVRVTGAWTPHNNNQWRIFIVNSANGDAGYRLDVGAGGYVKLYRLDPPTGQFDSRVFDYSDTDWKAAYENIVGNSVFSWMQTYGFEDRVMLLISQMPVWLVSDPETRYWPYCGVPTDMNVWAQWAEGLVEMFYNSPVYPNLRPPYIEIWNEPDGFNYFGDLEIQADPTNPFPGTNGEVGAQKYCDLFNAAVPNIKARWPELKVGGPTLAHGLFWAGNITWRQWMPRFIEQCGDSADFFDLHWYGHFREPDDTDLTNEVHLGYNHESMRVELNAFHNYQLVHGKKPLPIMVSEYNVYLDRALGGPNDAIIRQKNLLWIARVWFDMFEEPDKIEGMTYHVARNNDDDPFSLFDADGVPRPNYSLFWLFRNMAGQRLLVQEPESPIKAIASLDSNYVRVVAFNDSDSFCNLPVSVQSPGGTRIIGVTAERLSLDDVNTIEIDTPVMCPVSIGGEDRWVRTMEIPAYGLLALDLELDSVGSSESALHLRDYFADAVMSDIPANLSIDLPTSVQPASAVLRLGLQGALNRGITVTLNSQSLTVPAVTTSSLNSSYLEIPVDVSLLSSGSNALAIGYTVSGETPRVAFAALRIQMSGPVCGDWGYATMDFNQDCYVDFLDFVLFTEEWLVCSKPNDANCTAF